MKPPLVCLLAILCLVSSTNSNAQTTQPSPLRVGDMLPRHIISNVRNNNGLPFNTGALQAPLTILDFWATWCGSCMAAIPEMHHLQEEFKDSLQVMMVNNANSDTQAKVTGIFAARQQRSGQAFTLPYILQDTLLSAYFPHYALPHYVWLGQDAKVLAITGADEVTAINIRRLLAGQGSALQQKDDALLFDAAKESVFSLANTAHNTLFSSVLSGEHPGKGGVIGRNVDSNGLLIRYYMVNYSLQSMCRLAFPSLLDRPYNHIFINPDIRPLFFESDTIIKQYCYEFTCPPADPAVISSYLQADLLRAFNITVIQKDSVLPCFVLTVIGSTKSLLAHGGVTGSDIDEASLRKYFNNTPLSDFTGFLGSLFPGPIVDETGITQNITLPLPPDINKRSLAAVNSFLLPYGLALVQAPRTITIALLTTKQ